MSSPNQDRNADVNDIFEEYHSTNDLDMQQSKQEEPIQDQVQTSGKGRQQEENKQLKQEKQENQGSPEDKVTAEDLARRKIYAQVRPIVCEEDNITVSNVLRCFEAYSKELPMSFEQVFEGDALEPLFSDLQGWSSFVSYWPDVWNAMGSSCDPRCRDYEMSWRCLLGKPMRSDLV